jgi:shikimate dehydrogenase
LDGRIEGWTSDAAIIDHLDARAPVILGDGGSATAFLHAFRKRNVEARQFSRRGEWPPDVRGADVVINATPVRDEVLVELDEGQTLVDLPYPDSATARVARDAGATVVDGLEVLVRQGAASFELWTGVSAPLDVMRNAVRSAP